MSMGYSDSVLFCVLENQEDMEEYGCKIEEFK